MGRSQEEGTVGTGLVSDAFIQAMRKAGIDDIEVAADAATLHGYLPSGNLALNWILSGRFTGGWPLGHVSEIFGDPKTGKSFIIARAVAETLTGKGVALLDDTESAFNPIWASTSLGVDVSRLAYKRSHTIEEHEALVRAFINSVNTLKITDPSLVALDSLALLSNDAEVKAGMGTRNMQQAYLNKKFFRLTCRDFSDLNAAYLFTNHTIANIGDKWHPTVAGGGGGPKYQATIRLEMRTPRRMKGEDGQISGVRVSMFVEANRLVSPWKKTEIIIPFHTPLSPVSGLVALLLDLKGLEKTPGHKLAYQGTDTGIFAHSTDLWKQDQSALDLLEKYPSILQDLEKQGIGNRTVGTTMVEEGQEAE